MDDVLRMYRTVKEGALAAPCVVVGDMRLGIGKVDDGHDAVGRMLFPTESADDERHRSILSSRNVVKRHIDESI